MTEQELLLTQIRSYEFYADLIDRSSGNTNDELPKWNSEKARKYRILAEQYRKRLLEITAKQAKIAR